MPTHIEEPDVPGLTPRELALRHARAKLAAALERAPGYVVVAADTVVDLDGEALNKPLDAAGARSMLRRLAGRDHVVHTAAAAADPASGRRVERQASTRVRFYPLDDGQIEAYVATGEPFDKAGSYGIQGRGACLVEAIEGDFYTVMGFPLGAFVRALPELGYRLAPTATGAVEGVR